MYTAFLLLTEGYCVVKQGRKCVRDDTFLPRGFRAE